MELGRWVFLAPLGYINAPRAMGKSLMPDPERAPIVRRVFEEYATGRFTKQQVLEQAWAWGLTNRRNRPLTSQAIGTLLRNRLYAGIVGATLVVAGIIGWTFRSTASARSGVTSSR